MMQGTRSVYASLAWHIICVSGLYFFVNQYSNGRPQSRPETRKNHGLSQAELAQKAGVTPAAISQIEKGSRVPTIPVLHRIANVLGVSLDFLIGKTDKSEVEDMLQHDEFKTFFRGFESLDETDKEFIKKNIEFLRTKTKGR